MKKSLLVSSIVLAGGILLSGCSELTSEEPQTTNQVSTQEDHPQKNQTFKVGEAIQLGNNVVTVTGMKKIPGGEWDSLKDGDEYTVVHVKINNNGDDNISYNPFDFKVKNSKGQITDTAFAVGVDDELDAGDLAPGGEVEGSLTFETPIDDGNLQLIYQPDFWDDGSIVTVNLQ